MFFLQLEIAVFMMVTAYLGYSRAMLCQRNARSWEELLLRLQAAWALDANRKPTDQSPRALFLGARTALEMADFAEWNSDAVSPVLLAELRRDALGIKIGAARMMVRAAFSRSAK